MKGGYDHNHEPEQKGSWWHSRDGIIAIIFILFAGFYLLTEHRAHVYQALPWLIILLCPVMHLFMHHGHGGHKHHDDEGEK